MASSRALGEDVRAKRLEKPLTNPGMRSMACGGGFHIKAVVYSVGSVRFPGGRRDRRWTYSRIYKSSHEVPSALCTGDEQAIARPTYPNTYSIHNKVG